MNKKAEIFIKGHVQGIFFRSFVKSKAKLYDLKGWVKNTPDGGVQAVFEGEKENIEKIIEECWQGPPGAEILDIKVKWEIYSGRFDSFEIKQ